MVIGLVAYGNQGEIGLGNDLLWHLPNDLKRFKSQTLGHCVVMGRKTFESIGRPLPKRTNVLVTRDENWIAPEGLIVFNDLEHALGKLANDFEKVFVIGGGEIYRQSLAFMDEVWATEVDTSLEADTFFPIERLKNWKKEVIESHTTDEKHAYNYDFVRWQR